MVLTVRFDYTSRYRRYVHNTSNWWTKWGHVNASDDWWYREHIYLKQWEQREHW
jgi:hypothetical protein